MMTTILILGDEINTQNPKYSLSLSIEVKYSPSFQYCSKLTNLVHLGHYLRYYDYLRKNFIAKLSIRFNLGYHIVHYRS
jgi:hypothetical protein